MLLATLVFCVEITLGNKLANVTGNFSVLCRNNTGQQISKTFFVSVMNMLLIYLFASMKLAKGHKNYLALFLKLCSFIHSIFCLTTGPKPPPKRFLHTVRSRASSFKWQHPLLSLRSSSSFLRLLPRLLVTSISPFIFSSITYFRRQFLRKMWPIQLAFRFLISCRIFLCSLTLSNTSSFLT